MHLPLNETLKVFITRQIQPRGLFLVCVFGAWLGYGSELHSADSPTAPARAFDLQGFIDRQIQSGTNRVVIPSGRYLVAPKQGTHLRFQNLTNLEILADGVEMVCTETRSAIQIRQCINLHLRGMTMDYDPLPMIGIATAASFGLTSVTIQQHQAHQTK